jgi:hypothetical protein
LWQSLSGAFDQVQFKIDSAEMGRDKDAILEAIAPARLNVCLSHPDVLEGEVAAEGINIEKGIRAFGFRFCLDRDRKILIAL